MSTERSQMSTRATNRSMLRWYPSQWQARYGDEFIAMIEDDLGGRRPTLRYKWSIAQSGLSERLREVGMMGNSVSPSERVRGGALTVLCAFALFVLPGVGFAKISEHWDESIHRGSRHLPAVSFNLLGSLAVACAVAVLVAAAALLPTFVQFIRTGGWPAIRRRVWWGVIATLATIAVGAGLVVWAGHLTNHQRNSGLGWYQLLFVITAILFAATIATWSTVAVAITRRLSIQLNQLKMTGVLAVLVALSMPVMTAAAAFWWGSMAITAPWFLAGTPVGSSPSPLTANLLAVLIVMATASSAGVLGSIRVIRSWHQLQGA
jgi:drug/metabolite transporter (DMT)-like permease